MADGEDAQGLAAEVLALVLRRRRELELQCPLAGMAEPRAAEIVAGRPRGLIGGERLIDGGVQPLGEAGAMIVIEGQNGTSGVCARAMSDMASRKPSTASSISARTCASVSSPSGVAQPISSISRATRFMVAVIAARSSSVRSTMTKCSHAKRVQKDWQGIEQNQPDGRG